VNENLPIGRKDPAGPASSAAAAFGASAVAGGLLWAGKTLYDTLALGRGVDQGYAPTDPTDWIRFALPLLCIGGVLAAGFVRRRGWAACSIAGLVLIASYFAAETFLFGRSAPYGLLLLFPGFVLSFAGAAGSFAAGGGRWYGLIAASAGVIVLTPFLQGALVPEAEVFSMVAGQTLFALGWSGLGYAERRKEQ